MKKYSWRINEFILNYPLNNQIIKTEQQKQEEIGDILNYVYYIQDDFLSLDQLTHLQCFFSNSSLFWKEHSYNFIHSQSMISGYFSYLFPFHNRKPICSIEQIIMKVYKTLMDYYPERFQEAQVAEWWVHSRPHCCGHQLHYDSDESRITKGGKPNHPIASCVLYLSEIGGPTMISDQMLNGNLGSQTWLVNPKLNRLFVFNAKYLHGVIPGVGPIPSGKINDHRVTLMIGFWKSLEASDKGLDRIGAGQPFPLARINQQTKFTWPNELPLRSEWEQEKNEDDMEIVQEKSQEKSFQIESLADYNIHRVAPFWRQLKEKPSKVDDYESFYQGF